MDIKINILFNINYPCMYIANIVCNLFILFFSILFLVAHFKNIYSKNLNLENCSKDIPCSVTTSISF